MERVAFRPGPPVRGPQSSGKGTAPPASSNPRVLVRQPAGPFANARAATAGAQARAIELPVADPSGRLERLVPLWRHAVWLVALFAILTMWVNVRVDVQQIRKDLDRSGRAHREARIQNDRLRLELDARRRSVVLESAAHQLAATDAAPIVRIESTPGGARP